MKLLTKEGGLMEGALLEGGTAAMMFFSVIIEYVPGLPVWPLIVFVFQMLIFSALDEDFSLI